MDASLPFDAAQVISPANARRIELLEQLVDLAAAAASSQIDELRTQWCDALQRAAARDPSGADAARYANAATLLKQNRYPFFYLASARMRAALEQQVRVLAPALPFAATEPAAPVPALAADLDAAKKLALIKLAHVLEGKHARGLEALGRRLGALLGTAPVVVARNPFAPLVLLNALHDAWCEFLTDAAAHPLLFRLLTPSLGIDLDPVLDKCNTLLIKHGLLPTIDEMGDTIVVVPERAAAAGSGAPAAVDPAQVQKLKQLFGDAPAKRVTAQAPAKNDFPSLLNNTLLEQKQAHDVLLEQVALLQKQYLAQATVSGAPQAVAPEQLLGRLKRQAPPDGWPSADVMTIDLLIRAFDAVFADASLPVDIRTLISTLQLPMLKAALQDREFFFSAAHPARHALKLLAQIGVGYDARRQHADAQYQLVLRNVKRIQSDQRMPSFAAAVADMQAYLAQEESETSQTLAAPIAQALQREKTLVAEKTARNEVALRIGTGEVVAFVETFLEDRWVPVLTLAYAHKDDKPDAVASALSTMDDLCWSVKPKITPDERKELIVKLPAIVRRLNKWLDAVMWHDEARVDFFDQLARCHASIVRAPVEISPERQLKYAMKVAQRAATRRMQREARGGGLPVSDAFDAQVREIARDSWVQFAQSSGITVKLKLAWISPERCLYLFATRERKEAFSLTDAEFAAALRDKRARILSVADVVGQAMDDAVQDASANDGGIAARAAA